MEISTNFCGGNAVILEQGENFVRFQPNMRDTSGVWFYWAFRVTGAAGKTVRFAIEPQPFIGYHGAAVSHDLYEWHWSGNVDEKGSFFTYTFASDEDCVYFAHDMLYHPSRFYRFAERMGFTVKTLCEDSKGTPIPYAVIGEGENNILLTARHHCCEATGDYIMEGIIEEFIKNPIPDCRLTAIPFVDADGVVAGDQGKNRRPHDHNRDYVEFLYQGTRAVKKFADAGDCVATFDLHSPYHTGRRNDHVFLVIKNPEMMERITRFGRCFASVMTPNAMRYTTEYDIAPDVEWNHAKEQGCCAVYCAGCPNVDLAFSLETTYFGTLDDIVTQSKLLETGRCFIRGYALYKSF